MKIHPVRFAGKLNHFGHPLRKDLPVRRLCEVFLGVHCKVGVDRASSNTDYEHARIFNQDGTVQQNYQNRDGTYDWSIVKEPEERWKNLGQKEHARFDLG